MTLSLQDHDWLTAKPLVRILSALNIGGLNARLVGGCVRDAILGRKIIDIDLACSLTPEETISRLEKIAAKVIPTGIKHGTITAVLNKSVFEITTLRKDLETYGRHAKVGYTDSWLEDAQRRDFTFNALYLDGDGSLYDPCGGYQDLQARHVRFIGDADQRIREDALRILRFFRFAAQIGQGRMDSIGLEACIRNKDMVTNLSGERIAQELFKILQADNLLPIMDRMAECRILECVLPDHRDLKLFTQFVRLERALGRCDILGRLSCLMPEGPEAVSSVSSHLKLSNKQVTILNHYMNSKIQIKPEMTDEDIQKSLYLNGMEQFIFTLLKNWAASGVDATDNTYGKILSYAESWLIPIFPVQGRDLIKAGLPSGPELGTILAQLEREWLESHFALSREALLEKAAAI